MLIKDIVRFVREISFRAYIIAFKKFSFCVMMVWFHKFADISLAFETAADDLMGYYISTRLVEINSRLFFKSLRQTENGKFITS